ncbi:MAG: chondroitinase-B domain-containing protein [Bacteroidota bacterium]
MINNYCEGLTGYRFRGALVVMNGVPNSPPNRYFQVTNSEASNNTFVNCDHIQLCAGSDEERSAVPINSKVEDNIFYHAHKEELFTVYDDISGIAFKGNLISEKANPITTPGFQKAQLHFERGEKGLLMPQGEVAKGKGMKPSEDRATPANTGLNWYPRKEEEVFFGTGKTIPVKAGENTLYEAIQNAKHGDVLELESGHYVVTKSIDLSHPISITSKAAPDQKPHIQFQRTSLFNIENGGSLSLKNVLIDGSEAPDAHGNTVIRTSRYSMSRNYKLFVEDCEFKDLDINHTFDVLRVYKNTFADSIVFKNSSFTNIDGNVLALNKETDDIGIYNAENVVIDKCTFKDISGIVLDLHRGGRDESTFGPMLVMKESTLTNVGKGKRNKAAASISLHGVQWTQIQDSRFSDCQAFKVHLVVGEPITKVQDCIFSNTEKIETNDGSYESNNLVFK